MKRIRIDRASLEALYPPMDAAFERELRQRIAGLPGEREKVMKKKTGLALVLAAALLLALAATALAAFAASQGFFADVARIQLEGGYYDGWTLAEKEQVVRLMKENGILTDAQAWDAALRETDAQQREAALDSLFAERYGVNGRTDVIGVDSILIKEKGPLETWSMEDKAWYSAMLEDIGLLGSDAEVYMLPDEDAISVQEAERIAKDAVISAYGMEDGALDDCTALVDCREYIDEVGVLPPYFLVELRRGENPLYWVCVSQEGRVLSSEDGYDAAALHLIEDDYTTTDWEGCKGMINQGKIGCMVLGSWAYPQMVEAGPNGDDIGYMSFPITVNGKQYASAGADYSFGINKNSSEDDQIAAMLFVKWFTEESGFAYSEGGIPIDKKGEYPAVYAAFEGIEFIPDTPAVAGEETLLNDLNAETELRINAGGDAKIQEIIEHGFNGTKTFDEIMDDWNERWTDAQDYLGIEVNQ